MPNLRVSVFDKLNAYKAHSKHSAPIAQSLTTICCNGQSFSDIQVIFLDKDGTLANVAAYLSQIGYRQAQLMEEQLSGVYELVLRTLGFSIEGRLLASGLLAVGSRQETILGTAAAAAMLGLPWLQAIELATLALTTADQEYRPKAAHTPLLPGAADFLAQLKTAKLTTAIVSADSQRNLEQFVDFHQLQPYVDIIQGVSAQQPSKIGSGFLQTACAALGVLPTQGIVIGDAATDWQMAQTTRGFIGFLGGWQPQIATADIISKNPSGLPYAFATEFKQVIVV